MKIFKSEFIKSSNNYKNCPQDNLPEYAFIGRSNVGKSSLLNMLVNNKKLSKTSSKPGKTKLINHFKINNSFFFVDLPGYGWAKSSKKERRSWLKMIKTYLTKSQKLSLVFILIDIRIPPQKVDLEFLNFLGFNKIPVSIIFTKMDKLNKATIEKNKTKFEKEILQKWESSPTLFLSSAKEKIGRDEILNYITDINNSIN